MPALDALLLGARDRTEDEGQMDAFIRERGAKNLGQAARLEDQAVDFDVERVLLVGAVVGSVAVASALDCDVRELLGAADARA